MLPRTGRPHAFVGRGVESWDTHRHSHEKSTRRRLGCERVLLYSPATARATLSPAPREERRPGVHKNYAPRHALPNEATIRAHACASRDENPSPTQPVCSHCHESRCEDQKTRTGLLSRASTREMRGGGKPRSRPLSICWTLCRVCVGEPTGQRGPADPLVGCGPSSFPPLSAAPTVRLASTASPALRTAPLPA